MQKTELIRGLKAVALGSVLGALMALAARRKQGAHDAT